jgi:hypothetical protein
MYTEYSWRMRPHGKPTRKLVTSGRLVIDLRCEDGSHFAQGRAVLLAVVLKRYILPSTMLPTNRKVAGLRPDEVNEFFQLT